MAIFGRGTGPVKVGGVTVAQPEGITCAATGLPCETTFEVEQAAGRLLKELEAEAVIITLDKDGAFMAHAGHAALLDLARHLTD